MDRVADVTLKSNYDGPLTEAMERALGAIYAHCSNAHGNVRVKLRQRGARVWSAHDHLAKLAEAHPWAAITVTTQKADLYRSKWL